jgi:hypothetical protein
MQGVSLQAKERWPMRRRLVIGTAAALLTLSACAEAEPQAVEVTRQVAVSQTVEVTRRAMREVTREV